MLATLCTEVIFQRENLCHTSLAIRDHSLERDFFSQADGKVSPYQLLGGDTGTAPAAAF